MRTRDVHATAAGVLFIARAYRAGVVDPAGTGEEKP
jgi:hypothetical protein